MLTRRHLFALPFIGTLLRPRLKRCTSKVQEWTRLLAAIQGEDRLDFVITCPRGRTIYARSEPMVKSSRVTEIKLSNFRVKEVAKVALVDREGYILHEREYDFKDMAELNYTYTVNHP